MKPAAKASGLAWPALAGVNRILFDAFVGHAKLALEARNFENALQWCSVAAWSATGPGWFGALSSADLEAVLLRVAEEIPRPSVKSATGSAPRWLHVMTEAYGTLGHTNLCRRWIQYDKEAIHDLVLLNQRGAAPQNLADAVEAAKGRCVVLDSNTSALDRARELRSLAWTNADVVLLHTHPDDVIAMAAFGVEGGPPVLFLNHADHAFWVGCAVADLVVDIRSSGHLWTNNCRGVDRASILPIPLSPGDGAKDGGPTRQEERDALRARFNVPKDATVFLTVGSAAKYRAIPGFNFVNAALNIIHQCEVAYLLAVGPRDEAGWRDARLATNGRILAVGHQPDSTAFCRAADLYIEGFPAGSLTAMLEAAQAGLACVRAPNNCTPPFTSDGIAFEAAPQPADVNEYVQRAVILARETELRVTLGATLRQGVESNHVAAGWLKQLAAIKARIPKRHGVYAAFQPNLVPDAARDWMMSYLHSHGPAQSVDSVLTRGYIEAWKRTNSKPEVAPELWTELHKSAGTQPDQNALGSLNREIRRQGSRGKMLALASDAFKSGKYSLGRKMIYRCIPDGASCLVDPDWLKLFVKLHLGNAWNSQLRKSVMGRSS
jgi:hypothetical protein